MNIENYRYSVLYKTNVILKVNSSINNEGYKNIKLPSSDIVSISIINNYDTATFPIIRLRIYTELENVLYLTEDPDDIHVSITMCGNVYRMTNNDTKTTTPVAPAENIEMSLKGYIENKNIPVSVMDNYDNGIKKSGNLNELKKVPIEIFCYDDKLIHFMRSRTKAIYKDMTIQSIVETIFRNQGILDLYIDPFDNQDKYSQVLIPNLNINDTLSFFESMYGMYWYGAQIYGDIDKFYITNSMSLTYSDKILPIFVENYKNNSDMGGMRKINTMYQMNIKSENISIISETDIEKIMNAELINSVNVNTHTKYTAEATKLFPNIEKEIIESVKQNKNKSDVYMKMTEKYSIPDILHKSQNKAVAYTTLARIYERLTRVDISGVGFDVGKMKIKTRYNLVFDSGVRGIDMNQSYRATYINHIFTNLDSDLFIAQTTMNLCNNI